MTNKYFDLSAKEKMKFQLKLILVFLIIFIPVLVICYYIKVYFLAPLFLWIIISIIASFFDVPSMVKSGKLTYQSGFLLSEKERNNEIVIHGGTIFDYYFNLVKNNSRKDRKVLILSEYLKGLLHLIEQNENNPDLQIKGTTYILNERTASKIGFQPVKTDSIQKLTLILNYPNLMVTKSIANRKLSFPELNSIKTYSTSIGKLKENKAKIDMIKNKLLNG